jgi:hypothetical protein
MHRHVGVTALYRALYLDGEDALTTQGGKRDVESSVPTRRHGNEFAGDTRNGEGGLYVGGLEKRKW